MFKRCECKSEWMGLHQEEGEILLWGIEGQCEGLSADKTDDDAKPSQAKLSIVNGQSSTVRRGVRLAGGRHNDFFRPASDLPEYSQRRDKEMTDVSKMRLAERNV